MQFLYGALMWGGGLALVYYGLRYAAGLLWAIMTSAPMLCLSALLVLAVPVGFAWNYFRSQTGHEYLPFSYQERLLPFMTATDLHGYETGHSDELRFRVTNRSVYPVGTALVQCTYDTDFDTGYSEQMLINFGSKPLQPGESRYVHDGSYPHDERYIPLRNGKCTITEANWPFNWWSGFPPAYENLDWRKGS